DFTPFWYQNAGWKRTNHDKWRLSNTVTLYDKYGQELENLNPLSKYSAAIFAFKGELPAAVASNARNREIYYNGFEDIYYQNAKTLPLCDPNYYATITYSSGKL